MLKGEKMEQNILSYYTLYPSQNENIQQIENFLIEFIVLNESSKELKWWNNLFKTSLISKTINKKYKFDFKNLIDELYKEIENGDFSRSENFAKNFQTNLDSELLSLEFELSNLNSFNHYNPAYCLGLFICYLNQKESNKNTSFTEALLKNYIENGGNVEIFKFYLAKKINPKNKESVEKFLKDLEIISKTPYYEAFLCLKQCYINVRYMNAYLKMISSTTCTKKQQFYLKVKIQKNIEDLNTNKNFYLEKSKYFDEDLIKKIVSSRNILRKELKSKDLNHILNSKNSDKFAPLLFIKETEKVNTKTK